MKMKTLLQFMLYLAIAVGAIVVAVIVGNYGLWYLSWFIGTALIVLCATAGGVLFDTQERHGKIN
jgi:predicted MFS family arabinose efflux permease